jgi:hypothetical protein
MPFVHIFMLYRLRRLCLHRSRSSSRHGDAVGASYHSISVKLYRKYCIQQLDQSLHETGSFRKSGHGVIFVQWRCANVCRAPRGDISHRDLEWRKWRGLDILRWLRAARWCWRRNYRHNHSHARGNPADQYRRPRSDNHRWVQRWWKYAQYICRRRWRCHRYPQRRIWFS